MWPYLQKSCSRREGRAFRFLRRRGDHLPGCTYSRPRDAAGEAVKTDLKRDKRTVTAPDSAIREAKGPGAAHPVPNCGAGNTHGARRRGGAARGTAWPRARGPAERYRTPATDRPAKRISAPSLDNRCAPRRPLSARIGGGGEAGSPDRPRAAACSREAGPAPLSARVDERAGAAGPPWREGGRARALGGRGFRDGGGREVVLGGRGVRRAGAGRQLRPHGAGQG